MKTEAAAAAQSPPRQSSGDAACSGRGFLSRPRSRPPPVDDFRGVPDQTQRPSAPLQERNRAQAVAVTRRGRASKPSKPGHEWPSAKQAAERVAAAFYARNRFASAQTKERDGMAALGKSNYAAAADLFSAAQSDYQAATAEAPQEEEKERQLAG